MRINGKDNRRANKKAENTTQNKGSIQFLFHGLRAPFAITMFFGIICWTICNVYNDILLADMFSAFTSNSSGLRYKCIRYFALIIIWTAVEFIVDIADNVCAEDIEVSTRKYYFQKMYRCKPNILRNFNTGYISGLVNKLSTNRSSTFHTIIGDIPLATVYLISVCSLMLVKYHWSYALVIFCTSVIAILFRIKVIQSNKPNIDEISEAEADNTRLFLDTGTNVNTTQKLQAAPFILKKFSESIKRCRHAIVKYCMVDEVGFCGFKLIANLTLPICLVIYLYNPDIIVNKSEFFPFLAVVQLRLLHMVRSFSALLRSWEKYRSPFDKLENILNKENIRKPLSTNEFSYAEIKNCDYSYEYEDPEDRQIRKTARIQIPDFKIYKGDIICIHGESGQGKTTLLNILSGEIETENVYINGKQTTDRLDCVFIAQDTEIFDMTIADNLSLGNDDIPESEIHKMFAAVGLEEWLLKQPDGLNTRLGERGVFVSTGQRQRLNLVRGLLIPYGEIYLLDEPTSNVDNETEEKMIELIREKLKGKTAVIVTHKPRIMKICNKSYSFKDGIVKLDLH